MKNRQKKAIVILGPTSSGKSEMAVRLAKKFNGEIISADSRQIYRDMNLGTGKVKGEWGKISNSKCKISKNQPLSNLSSASSADKLSEGRGKNEEVFVYEDIPHHLIDFVDPGDEYNVSHFKKDCEKLINEISARGKIPIICGGTGFWILSVVNDIDFPAVKPNEKLRKELAGKSESELLVMLKELDSRRAKTVDSKNKQRLIRAIEIAKELGEVPNLDVFKASGGSHESAGNLKSSSIPLQKGGGKFKTPSTLLCKGGGNANTTNEPVYKTAPARDAMNRVSTEKFQFLQIGIEVSKDELENKIKKRLESRFLQGMIEEVKNLKEKYDLNWEEIQKFGLGYYWIPLFLQNKISEEELRQKVFEAERRYAKKQRTWFGKHKGVEWVEGLDKGIKLVEKFL